MRLSLAILALLAAMPARANDSTATIGAGGLVLEKTRAIDMASEDLFISVDLIRVDYVFRNRTSKPVTTIVAFPMPDRRMVAEYGRDVAYPSGFVTSVDGRPVAVNLERKAMVKGRDRRALLERLRVPVAPESIAEATAAMDRLRSADQAALITAGLAGEEQYDDDGTGMKTHLIPLWTVQDRYWWRQTFLPGRNLKVSHRYVPGAGGSVDSAIAFGDFRKQTDGAVMIAEYCIDRAFLAAVDARRGKGPDGPMMPDRQIDYWLTTGANWARPIGRFRLVVDKGAPGNLVSFCATGIRKISPTQFEVVKRDYRPTRDLNVLIVSPQN